MSKVLTTLRAAIPCNYTGPISLVMGGKPFSYNPLDFILGKYNATLAKGFLRTMLNTTLPDEMCLSSFMAADIPDPSQDPNPGPATNSTRYLTVLVSFGVSDAVG